MAQCGLCSAFPRVLQRTQRCECRVCQDGVQEPAALSRCSGAAAPWLRQGRGHGFGHSCSTKARALVPSSHCCPGGSGSAPLPPAWAGAILGPCSCFRVSALLPPGTRLFVRLQLPGGRRDPSPPLRLCHAARASPDELFHQLQVHALCSCHVRTTRPHLLLVREVGSCLAWGNHPLMYNKKIAGHGCFLGHKCGQRWSS